VLDGVVPPDLALGPDVAREAQRALEQIFARCAGELHCGARFQALPENFAALLARLDKAAELDGGTGTPLSGAELRMFVRLMSYSASTVALLPVLLHEAHTGNYAPLTAQARSILRELPKTLSFPMSSSVTCTEDAPFVESSSDAGLDATYLGTTIVASLQTLCAQWPAGEIDADFRQPVSSDKPVLLLSGDTDPITPPTYAERVAAGLTNTAHVVGRGQGHGLAGVGCVPRVLRAFLEDPRPHALDSSCLEREPPTPFFLTLLGPAP
jgi:pimeloyl-ACP methyl ester carboxylesterase